MCYHRVSLPGLIQGETSCFKTIGEKRLILGLMGLIEQVIRLGNPMPVPAYSTDVVVELKGEGEMT